MKMIGFQIGDGRKWSPRVYFIKNGKKMMEAGTELDKMVATKVMGIDLHAITTEEIANAVFSGFLGK